MESKSETIKEEPSSMPYKAKLITSAVIWFCTFTLGLGVNFLGSSLLELSHKFQTDIATISKVFSVITASFLIGSISCAVLFNYVNRQIASAVLIMGMGLATIALPLAPSLTLFFCFAGVIGITAAGYNTAQIVWIIEMWQNKAAPYIQTQHFSFAIGSFISPLIVRSFLAPDPQGNSETIELKSNYSQQDGFLGEDTLKYHEAKEADRPSLIYIPFLIGGLAAILGGLLLLILYCLVKYEKPAKITNAQDSPERADEEGGFAKSCNTRKVILVFLSAIVLGTNQGMEMCSIQFLPTFTHFIDLKLSPQDGALVLTGLAGAFTVGRGIGILIIFKIRPELLLLTNIIFVIIGNTLLLFFAHTSYAMLWIASISLGIGFSTIFPSFYVFIEKHLKVSNVVGGCMIVAEGIVSGLYPIIIGTYIERNPLVLMYTNYFSLITCTSSFLIIYCITRGSRTTKMDFRVSSADVQTKENGGENHAIPLKTINE